MSSEIEVDDRYRDLLPIAAHQRGLFTLEQASNAGFDPRSIQRALRRRRWEEVAPRVYRAMPAGPLLPIDDLHAAALSADALAARLSTLALCDLHPHPFTPQLLVVRSRRNLDRPGMHSTRSLPDEDRTTIAGIPSTTAIRATIDACGRLPRTLATRVVTKAIVRRRFQPAELVIRADELRNPRRPGAVAVLRIVQELNPSIAEARNEWEALIGELAVKFGLPAPVFNFRVDLPNGPRFLDAAWPPVWRGIEYDGYWEHLLSTQRFDDDRARQSELQEAGWILDRCTNRMLRKDPMRVFTPLLRAHDAAAAA